MILIDIRTHSIYNHIRQETTTAPYMLIDYLKWSPCWEAKVLNWNFQCFATLGTGSPAGLASEQQHGSMVKPKSAILLMLCWFLIISKSCYWKNICETIRYLGLYGWHFSLSHLKINHPMPDLPSSHHQNDHGGQFHGIGSHSKRIYF